MTARAPRGSLGVSTPVYKRGKLAKTPSGALAESRRLGPDIVLLDVQLPDLDGFEVAEQITCESTVAVVLTSSHDVAEFEQCVAESGARGFVPKTELSREAIEELLG